MADDSAKKKIKEVNEELGYLEDALLSIADKLSTTIKQAITDVKDEAMNVNQIFAKDLQKGIKSVAKESNNILSNQLKIAQGTAKTKDISKQILNNEVKQKAILRAIANLKNNGIEIDNETLELQRQAVEEIEKQNDLLKTQRDEINQIQKRLGVTGKLIKGISKIPVLGNLIDAEEALAVAQAEAAKEGSNRAKVMGAAFKQLGASLKENLTDPLVTGGLFVKGLKTLIGFGNQFSKSIFDISQNQAITYNYARLEAQRLMDASVTSKNILATQQSYVESTNALNDALGVANMYTSKQLDDYIDLTKKLGLTTEEAATYAEFSAMSGKSAESIVNSVAKQTKGNLNNKKVIQDVAKVNGQLFAQYKGSPSEIAKAVVQTQKLGMSLQQAQNIARGLLNFEDSITNELEAELLTGKNLNLEKARYLALQGDAAGAAEEVAKQVGGLHEFTKLNVIQQEALAKAAGMGVDEFTDTLRKKEAIRKLDQSQVKLYQEEIKRAKEAKDIEKANALEKAMLGGKNFELSKMELDNASKAQAAFDKAKTSFMSGIAPVMESVSRFLLKITDFLNKPFVQQLLKFAGYGLGIVTAAAGIKSTVSLIKGLFGGRVQKVFVTNMDGGGEEGEGGLSDMIPGTKFKGTKPASFLKKLTRPKTMMKALTRSVGKKGLVKTLGKGLLKGITKGGIAGILGGVALDYASESQMEKAAELEQKALLAKNEKEKKELEEQAKSASNIGKGIDVGSSALGGAATGAMLTSWLGPGAAIGGIIGGLIGAGYGAYQNYFKSDEDKLAEERGLEKEPTLVDDFIYRPGQKPIKFRKDDIILGGTNVLNDKNINKNTNDIGSLLQEFKEMKSYLAQIANKEGAIYLDSTKVGTAMNMGTSRIK